MSFAFLNSEGTTNIYTTFRLISSKHINGKGIKMILNWQTVMFSLFVVSWLLTSKKHRFSFLSIHFCFCCFRYKCENALCSFCCAFCILLARAYFAPFYPVNYFAHTNPLNLGAKDALIHHLFATFPRCISQEINKELAAKKWVPVTF